MAHDQKWFEMVDLKKRSLTRASWVPLRACDDSRKRGKYGYLGYEEEYFGAIAVLFPANESEKALAHQWTDFSFGASHKPYVENSKYIPAGTYESYRNELAGNHAVLIQSFDTGEPTVWHLTQDIVLGLGLHREGDAWLRSEEDYLKVARIRRSTEGDPIRFEIRPEQLRDFLCARGCGLLVATYQSRKEIVDSQPEFEWEEGDVTETGKHYRWRGSIRPIHEGGMPYGRKTAVFHVGRTNIDQEDDLPTYGMPGEDEFESKSWEISDTGEKLFLMMGEMWRTQWIPPSDTSPRVREDRIKAQIPFIIEPSGKVLHGEKLEFHRGWLWFRPSVIQSLLEKRRGFLQWYTEDTGNVGPALYDGVHFGVNDIGLINVLAKDIALLPEIYQKVWATHNVVPDGKVCRELLMSQMEGKPADTVAPEALLVRAIDHLKKASVDFMGGPILKEHPAADKIRARVHRFHGDSIEGICFLCKELTRLTIERINVALLKKADPTGDRQLGPIKRLAHFLDSKGFDGRTITAPLAGAYELRAGDAHLPSDEISDALSLLGIDKMTDHQKMAKQTIHKIAFSLGTTGDVIIKSYQAI